MKKDQLSLTDKDYIQLAAEYKSKDKEVKKSCKEDKAHWIEGKLQEAKTAATKGDSKPLYKITEELSGKPSG